jgi:hypothetical protein
MALWAAASPYASDGDADGDESGEEEVVQDGGKLYIKESGLDL